MGKRKRTSSIPDPHDDEDALSSSSRDPQAGQKKVRWDGEDEVDIQDETDDNESPSQLPGKVRSKALFVAHRPNFSRSDLLSCILSAVCLSSIC